MVQAESAAGSFCGGSSHDVSDDAMMNTFSGICVSLTAADLAFFWLHTDRGRLTGRSLALASRAMMVCDYAGDPERRWGRYLRLARAELGRFDPTDDATVSPMTACIFDALGNPPPGFEGDAVSDPAALVSHLLDRD